MHYYEVFVAEAGYQKTEPLTYSYPDKLAVGTVVAVPFGKKSVSGFIKSYTAEPTFKTKPLAEVFDVQLSAESLALHEWMMGFYPAGSGVATQLFMPPGSGQPKRPLPPSSDTTTKSLPPLTNQQTESLARINTSQKDSFLLHGETGSGKTRVYIELAEQAIKNGQSAIILTPEISLVPQLLQTFSEVFGDQVVVLHSGLTKAQRNRNWYKIAQSKRPLVVIGTRSAAFAPLKNIGLLVVDEMHEPAYKQDSAPRYHTLRVAAKLAGLHKARIVYGSATPPVVEYFLATETKTPILRLSQTAKMPQKVTKYLIDLRDTAQFSQHRYLSDSLLQSIRHKLSVNEQAMLFLNRRGTARQILCQSCGWQALCPKCDLPLTFHADSHRVRCHTCGYSDSPPYHCPKCGSDDITYRSLGTKALVDDLQRLFPEARIRRFDTDNLVGDTLSEHFSDIQAGEIDILVGTQMLGKGLDLPHLSLVGIVNADTSLHMPDFSSTERTYQLLHQAIGRVGRGHREGEIIVQSFRPEDPLLIAALKQDWQTLYDHELAERKIYGFPPFCYLLKITVSRRSSQAAETYIRKLRQQTLALKLNLEIQVPTPSFYERSHGRYNWQLIIKAKQRKLLADVVTGLPAGDYTTDIDPMNLL